MSEPEQPNVPPVTSGAGASEKSSAPATGTPDHASGESTTTPPQAPGCDQGGVTYSDPPAYFTDALEDAELLLKYAAETGVEIDDKIRDSILDARAAVESRWTEQTAANLLAALTVLAAKLKPVTGESLRYFAAAKSHSMRKLLSRLMKRWHSSVPKTQPAPTLPQSKPAKAPERKDRPRRTVGRYVAVALLLALFIVPFSIASFITSGTSGLANLIHSDINTANDLAEKMTGQFILTTPTAPTVQQPANADGQKTEAKTAPAKTAAASGLPAGLSKTEVATEFQTFASLIRSIHARSRQLNKFIWPRERDPFADVLQQPGGYKATFQLPVPLPDDLQGLQQVLSGRILVFQDARQFGADVTDDVSVIYGAIGTVILPVLYALLGACACLLRAYAQGMSTRTFVPSHSDSARFLIAGIVGGVVGLFSNFTIPQGAGNQGTSVSPLAIAFLVGYSVDVFFSFLETLIQAFTKDKGGSNTPASSQVSGGSNA